MSRSFKKYTCYKITENSRKKIKRYSNHKIHYAKELKNGSHYKKITSTSYNRHYRNNVSLSDFVVNYLEDGIPLEKAYAYWVTQYYFK